MFIRWIFLLCLSLIVWILWVQFTPTYQEEHLTGQLQPPIQQQQNQLQPPISQPSQVQQNFTLQLPKNKEPSFSTPLQFPHGKDNYIYYQDVANFESKTTPVPLYFKQNPFPCTSPDESKVLLSGSLHLAPYMWNYTNESQMNGATFGGIVPYEPVQYLEGAYPTPALVPHGKYPVPSPNDNTVQIPKMNIERDDLRMGMGIPARQGAYINQRFPM